MEGSGRIRRVSSIVFVFAVVASGALLLGSAPGARASSVLLEGSFTRLLVDPIRPWIYLGDAGHAAVVVWNTSSESPVASVPVGGPPVGMDLSADGSHLYAAVGRSLADIDLGTLAVVRDIPVSGAPVDVAVSANGLAFLTTTDPFGWTRIVNLTVGKEVGNVTITNTLYQGALAVMDPTRNFLFVGERGLSPASMFKLLPTANNATLVSVAPFASLGSDLVDAVPLAGGDYIFLAAHAPFFRSPNPYYVELMDTTSWKVAEALNAAPYPVTVSFAPGPGVAAAGDFLDGNGNAYTSLYAFGSVSPGASLDPFGSLYFSQEAAWARLTPDAHKLYAITKDFNGDPDRFEVASLPTPVRMISAVDGNGFILAVGLQPPITAIPNTPTTTVTVNFTTIWSPGWTGFGCSLDGGPSAPCSSPVTFTGLSYGNHTLSVSAFRGRWGSLPAALTWSDLAPVPTVQDLIRMVNLLVFERGGNQSSALLQPLYGALSSLEAGKIPPAIDYLKTFRATLRNDIKKTIISSDSPVAQALLAESCDLILVLGGKC